MAKAACTVPREEFLDRLARLREFMAQQRLDALLIYSAPRAHMWSQTGHVGYLSDWANRDRIPDTLVVVPSEGEPESLYSGLPYMNSQIAEVSWMSDVRLAAASGARAVAVDVAESPLRDFGGEVLGLMQEQDLDRAAIGLIGTESMPLPLFRQLEESLSGSELREVPNIVEQLQEIKSPAELHLMREAGRLVGLGYESVVKALRPGIWGYEIVAEAERAMRAAGADYAQFWMASGPAEGWNLFTPDLKPHRRLLNRGDQVICGAYVVFEGYWSHGMRAGTIGQPSRQLERNFEPCHRAVRAAAEAMNPGGRVGDMVKAARKAVEEMGYALQGGRLGHGIGLDYSERPYLREENEDIIKPGMTAVFHPQLACPELGGFFVPLGDVYCCTDQGAERLTDFPQELFVA